MSEEEDKMLRIERDHERLGREMRRYFMDQLDADESTTFRGHVRECTRCRQEYERWSSAERGLFAQDVASSPLAFDRIARAVIPQVAPEEAPRGLRWLSAPALGFALASAATLLFAGRFLLPSAHEPEAFLARGVEAQVGADLSARAVVARLPAGGGSPLVFDLSREGTPLEAGDRVQLRLTHDGLGFVRVFVVQGGVATPWGPAERLPAAGEDVAVSSLYSVGEALRAGPVELVVAVAEDAARLLVAPAPEAKDGPELRVRVVRGTVR